MNNYPSEKGQALVIITLAAVVMFGFAALAIDGSMVFSDKRHAQNAADTAALAGALAYSRGNEIDDAAEGRATSNGYDGGTMNDVTVTVTDVPSGECPANTQGKDIKVDIVSHVNTTFARVIGRTQMTNAVTATSRSCGSYYGPPFDGNAIVALAPSGTGFDANGTPDWTITGGGIMSNSSSSSAVACGGSATITAPSVTVVGDTDIDGCSTIGSTPNEEASQLTYSDYSALFPRQPTCNGTATFSGGQWHPQSGADGSQVMFTSGNMDFAPGLYCIMNSTIGPYHGKLTGTEVTFYIPSISFELKFDGNGNSFNATAPTSGEYKGVLMYLAPLVDSNGNLLDSSQALDLRGNGDEDIIGAIIAPSADVTMFGNSGAGALNSQVIAYHVDAGGNANIDLTYNAGDNYQAAIPITLTLLQ
ncbi:MAG: pilus assembly protein TadG-related protein [Anaerolineae bacterium]|nr:pilus assembly protein TadG-related protein [Anaerolineae bacterium]MCI0609050.1 pilus assembly protein TadG-related protein [Anaerolineae bacterium]